MRTPGNDTSNQELSIVFNNNKNELFKLNETYKILHRKLKSTWKVITNKDPFSKENEQLQNVKVLILSGCRESFTDDEWKFLREFIDAGGSLLVLATEGGDHFLNSNLSEFLEGYGIVINNDCVIRTQYYKYFHPKECTLNDLTSTKFFGFRDKSTTTTLVYPYGASLTVTKPAVVTLTSGNVCYPANRPLCAVYLDRKTGGRIAVLGSGTMLADKYIDAEQNDKFTELLFKFLTDDPTNLNDVDPEEFDVWDYHMTPDMPLLSDRMQLSIVHSASSGVNVQFNKLFNSKIYSLETDVLTEIIDGYVEANVKHEPLTLVVPHFEEATPRLELAVFPPSFSELPPPPLELFDLEESFNADEIELSQTTVRYLDETKKPEQITPSKLESYIRESCEILDIGQSERIKQTNARKLLYECARFVLDYKLASRQVDILQIDDGGEQDGERLQWGDDVAVKKDSDESFNDSD